LLTEYEGETFLRFGSVSAGEKSRKLTRVLSCGLFWQLSLWHLQTYAAWEKSQWYG